MTDLAVPIEPQALLSADGRPVVWIDDHVARVAHARLVSEHRGLAGGFDRVRLSAALAWPRTAGAFADRAPRLSTLAAAHARAILRLRPFHDGNEAMACLLSMLFLRVNGVELPAPSIEKYAMFAGLADGRLDTVSLARWMRMRHLANQRGVKSVFAVRISNGRVRGVASMPGSAANGPTAAVGHQKTVNRRPPSP